MKINQLTYHSAILIALLLHCHVVSVIAAAVKSNTINLDSISQLVRERIDHVVLMVLENRSFDHVLGKLNTVNSEVDGLTGKERNYWNVADESKGYQSVVTDSRYWRAPIDPEHELPGVTEQIFGTKAEPSTYPEVAPMNGFAQNSLSVVTKGDNITERRQYSMSTWPLGSLQATHTLAQEFGVFDRWFSAVPGPTMPNRQYIYSATSHGHTANNVGDILLGYPQATVYDSLNKKDIDWRIYFHDVPTSLIMRELRSPKNLLKLRLINRFYQHAREGRLPPFSLIEPRYSDTSLFPANDNHPPHDSRYSEKLIKDVYEALRASPNWNKTLLILTYDEHGGYYDHVPTPLTGVPSPDGIVGNAGERGEGFRFDRLGIRVPTILISPWISRGSVFHEPAGPQAASQFEHSSIPGFLKRHFKLDNYLTKRDEWAGAIEPALVQLKSPRMDCPLKLPDIPLPQFWQPSSPLGGQGDGDDADTAGTSDISIIGEIKDNEDETTGYFTSEARTLDSVIGSIVRQVRKRDHSGEAGL
ncbi:phosphoesterase family-domain-containing protein [Syncephalis plumigaleata]|nr:phosphoesterase family-domain-containing protein [Syncephalis plumigaleata]